MIYSSTPLHRSCCCTRLYALLAVAISLVVSSDSHAEEAWEFSTYRVDVVVVAAPGSGFTDKTEANICRGIESYAGITDVAVWNVQARSVPARFRYELANSFESPLIDLISGLDLVVIAKKDKHPDLKLKKLDYFLMAAKKKPKKPEDELKIGICDPRKTIVGQRSRKLLHSHWLGNDEATEADLMGKISDDASSPRELIEQVLGDELTLAIVRKSDVPESQEGLEVVPIDEVSRKDKLFLVVVDTVDGQFRVRAREYDCRGQLWGPVDEKLTTLVEALPLLAYEVVEFTFAPVVRIEEVSLDGSSTTTRLRAGGLIDPELAPNSPARLEVGSILRPIIRRNDRLGNVLENGIEALQWSYLEVVSQDGVRFGCDIYSAYRNPVGGRSSRRVERTALIVRPKGDSTELKLATKDDPPKPLSNYEIYEKDDDGHSVFLGKTDWRGSFKVGKGENPIRVLYVKNGQNILARLPVVPGLFSVETAESYDDSHRLWAEGRIRTLRASFLDLVARRQVLRKRILTEIEDGEYATAKQLAEQLSRLPSRSEFRMEIEDVAHDVASKNPRVQAKIEILLNDVRRILPDYLDPQLAPSLERAVEEARKNPANRKKEAEE